MARFDTAVAKVLAHEGGYVNNDNDPGGETKYGISRRTYPGVDIENLTEDDAARIYKADFWDRIRGDEIRWQDVADNLLDYAVNVGVRKAVVTIQRLAGAEADGVVGPHTLGAINRCDGPNLNLRLVLERVEFYTMLAGRRSEMRPFLLGWIRRALSYR